MQKWILSTLLFSLGLPAAMSATLEQSLGFAESGKKFTINRSDKPVPTRAGSLTPVEAGDQIQAAGSHVQVHTHRGDTVLVQMNSAAKFDSSEKVNVLNGDVVFAIPNDSKMKISIDGLVIEPLTNEKFVDPASAKLQHMVAVSRPDENHVKLVGFNNLFAVKAATGESQLAVVGNKDTVEFTRKNDQWLVVQAEETVPPPPGSEVEGAEGDDALSQEEMDEKKKRRGTSGLLPGADAPGMFGFSPFGIGAIVVATGVVVGSYTVVSGDEDDDDDEEDEDDDQENSSRIEPND